MSNGKNWRVKDFRAKKRRVRSEELESQKLKPHREKNWKMVYTRSSKVARARQLGFEYPKRDILVEEDELGDE